MTSPCLSQSNGVTDAAQEGIHSNVSVAVAASQLGAASSAAAPSFIELASVAADCVRAALATSRTLPDRVAETRP